MIDDIKDKIIYVSMPFKGERDEIFQAEITISALTVKYPQYTFISPILAFGHMYAERDFREWIENCLTLLDQCSEIMILGESKNTDIEKQYAERYKIPIEKYEV